MLLAVAGCASELTPQEVAELDAQGPYVDEAYDDEVASTSQALSGVAASTGYVWANNAGATAPYVPPSNFSFNSAGQNNLVTHQTANGQGRYRVDMPGLSAPGNVHVMAYGSNANRCNLRSSPSNAGGGVRFDINCFAHNGIPTDSMFVAFYNNTGESTGKLAMASVSSSGGISNFSNMLPGIHRGEGSYRLFMPTSVGLGVPFVTARSTNANFCNPSAHGVDLEGADGIKRFTDVRCFDASGAPADTAFHFSYMTSPKFASGLRTANGLSESTSDNFPGGYYTASDSFRVVGFDYFDPAGLNVTFFWAGIDFQSTAIVNAFTTSPVYCKSSWSGGGHFVTAPVCHDVNGNARKVRVSHAIFGLGLE